MGRDIRISAGAFRPAWWSRPGIYRGEKAEAGR